jgi:hypothetical protein
MLSNRFGFTHFHLLIQILLTPEEELTTNPHALNRQEIIALINTLHQFTKSVMFANSVSERLRLQHDKEELMQTHQRPPRHKISVTWKGRNDSHEDEEADADSSHTYRDYTMYRISNFP